MKFVLPLIFSAFIILKTGWNVEECGIRSAHQAIAPIVWYEQTIDGPGQNPIITRFFHNKIGIFVSQMTRCYFNRISPDFVFDTVGIFGLIFIFYLVYRLLTKKRWQILAVITVFSFLPTISTNFPTSKIFVNMLAIFYKSLAIVGLKYFLFKK